MRKISPPKKDVSTYIRKQGQVVGLYVVEHAPTYISKKQMELVGIYVLGGNWSDPCGSECPNIHQQKKGTGRNPCGSASPYIQKTKKGSCAATTWIPTSSCFWLPCPYVTKTKKGERCGIQHQRSTGRRPFPMLDKNAASC